MLLRVAATSSLLGAATVQAPTRINEADKTATALGNKHDTTRIAGKKYAAHRPAQKRSNCPFWQGAVTSAWAGCPMSGRKQIAKAGWCLAYKRVA